MRWPALLVDLRPATPPSGEIRGLSLRCSFCLYYWLSAARSEIRRGAKHTEFQPRGTAGCVPGS